VGGKPISKFVKDNRNVKAVIFDLDDTLFDHRYSCRKGLAALRRKYKCFRQITLDEFESEHRRILDEIHLTQLLTGRISLTEARKERFRRAFERVGEKADDAKCNEAIKIYRTYYEKNRRAVPGASQLLYKLKPLVKIAIVSNNLFSEQTGKLIDIGLQKYVDILVVSEHAGVTKPETAIFLETLKRLKCTANEAVMIGDSWEIDIVGALNSGIRPIWFNHYSQKRRDTNGVKQFYSYKPLDRVLNIIFNRG
jgi:putative hydrolase of the HAD superfamily